MNRKRGGVVKQIRVGRRILIRKVGPTFTTTTRRRRSSSIYTGVFCYARSSATWEARIRYRGERINLGGYDTAREAARAYDRAAIKLWGVDATLNFNISDYEEDKKQIMNLSAEDFFNGKVYRQKTFRDTRINLQKVLTATRNFADENVIMEGKFGKDYRGRMLQSRQMVNITARRLNHNCMEGDVEFWKEISTLYSLEHTNIVHVIGFCDEKDEKVIIYKHSVHGTLDQHLSNPNLTWFRRLQICLGVGYALSYIHYDVLHCDISSSKIFLDEDWEPKLFGFQLSTNYPQSWRHGLSISQYFDTKSMTPKHDVYSFGVLLFEVLCGRKPMIRGDGVKEELEKIIDPNLSKQMDTQALSIFIKVSYDCLNQQPMQRPNMDHIVKELEEAFEHQLKHENLEHSTAADEGALSDNLKMEWLEIPLSKILLATNNFDEEYCVGNGGFGIVYKAKLDVLDFKKLSSFKVKCKDELPKISKTVAIKRIFSRSDEGGKQGFLAEIELLTTCKHPNIVSLLGFSREGREMILVYEYAFKGSLDACLESNDNTMNLTWEQRIRICLDIARGINYLHTDMEGKPRIIHRDIKSQNILLDENLKAKVADFGLSKFHPTNRQASTIHTMNIAGTDVYLDPEYLKSYKYKKESDIYSFGVVLFEIICGRLAYDPTYMVENEKGLAPIARRRFNEGTLKELIDLKFYEENDESLVTFNRGPNQQSFEAFSRIAYQCLAETQSKRPRMETVIRELQNALYLQGETIVLSRFRLSDIVFATENFAETYCIGLHAYCKVYKAELDDFDYKSLLAIKEKNTGEIIPDERTTLAIKRISIRERTQGKRFFFSEMEHISYKHPKIVRFLGFCDEDDEMILVYEHAFNETLDDYLKRSDHMKNLTWTQRLHMCFEIASGLRYLHANMDCHHGDIRSANILLSKKLEAKIAFLGIAPDHSSNQEASTKVYCDPEYEKTRVSSFSLKKKSDIFSFGVILVEILFGRLAYDPIFIVQNNKGLASIARQCFRDRTLINKVIDPNLITKETKEENSTAITTPNQNSLDMFLKLADQCLVDTQAKRPTIEAVINKLTIALSLQAGQDIKQIPKVNGVIPSADEATVDRQRLLDRLQVYNLTESDVQGDGNCQFCALSDQLYRSPEHHKFVRRQVVNQLKSYQEMYEGYVPIAYKDYLKRISKSGEWGDHVTLQAAADSYGVKIFVLTSFKDTLYIEILPKVGRSKRVIFLSFWAEVYYNSVYPEKDWENKEVYMDEESDESG